jgi:glutathione peroxidase
MFGLKYNLLLLLIFIALIRNFINVRSLFEIGPTRHGQCIILVFIKRIFMSDTIYQFDAILNNGENINFKDYQGKVLLIVNTASKCGFTPQYEGLQSLYKQFEPQGLEVLGFPCDQFGHQEPGADAEIQEFCSLNFNVNFPLFKKIEVNGANAAPVYQYLKEAAPGLMGSKTVKWNFTKFLVNKQGKVTKRYASSTKPAEMLQDIEKLLAE